ncbi:FtsW/RodA/SpoVE family cell cycle protein [Clostridium sp. D2Q-11]|uniref:FtsW/RodA/SpoVE family cell cycle protein n=1 Tax=Anaeromonas frigoriresistens TaxID=2683708 RepID=A0A942USC6_9FIRM|nr:FtsW/RodA/SpoVE family cell cycle protein [Anaeromonas frigoriresistens]MBS4537703.1 FtsW/RodA/SpoVE family cell cycle protein [Anaeromonas frigoriresistens]
MLLTIGLPMIYRIDKELAFRQTLWYIFGLIVFFIVIFVFKKYFITNRYTYLYMGVIYIMFIMTFIFGSRIKGSINWIKFNGISFQPSEVIKILFILFIASYFTNRDKKLKKSYFLFIVYSIIGLFFFQKDLGSALLLYLVFMSIYYLNEENKFALLMNLFGAIIVGINSIIIFDHVKVRMISWINPWKYIDGAGYQITQSLFAISEGGYLGVGLGKGHPKYIPEVQTDFIFSAIIEEMGILMGIAIVLLYILFIYKGIKITLNQKNNFIRQVALGITMMTGFQAFIIIGGSIKLIPLTGITLPFVSYGGSSIVMSFVSIGLLQVASQELEGEFHSE